MLEGRYYGQAPDIDGVIFLSHDDGGDAVLPGQFVDVEIDNVSAYDLVGVVIPKSPLLLGGEELTFNLPRLDHF